MQKRLANFDDSAFADKIKPYRPSIDLATPLENLEEEDENKFELTSYIDGDELENNNLAMVE